jgi:hypothetical protein
VTRGALPFVAFTQVRNAWLRDERISYKAKGLLGYLASHAEGYRLSQAQIVRQGTDGRDSVVSGLAELERAGYLARSRDRRGTGGRFAEDEFTLVDPFDVHGKLLPVEPREILPSHEDEPRKTHQSGKPASGNPHRETRPIEEQGEKNTGRRTPPPQPPEGGSAGVGTFEEFWETYPRKEGKIAARRAWDKAVKITNPDKIVAAVREYPFDLTRRRYIKHPATWLNAGCWEDDLPAVAAARDDDGRNRSYRLNGRDGYDVGDGTF